MPLHGDKMALPIPPRAPFIVIGTGGHARVVVALLWALGEKIDGLTDVDPARAGAMWDGLRIIGDDSAIRSLPRGIRLANGIGVRPKAERDQKASPGTGARQKAFEKLQSTGREFPPLVHPSAVVAPDVRLASGTQIMAGAVLQPGVAIFENSVVNTSASVDHDCLISPHVFIAPGAILCGSVRVGAGAFIGAGAIVLPGVVIGEEALVAAGAVARHDVPANGVVM